MPLNIILSSISDCREKNGIVTFLQIFRKNVPVFREKGILVQFANFVDFPSDDLVTAPKNSAPLSFWKAKVKKSLAQLKQRTKQVIVSFPLGAFLLMLMTLGARGLVAAWKARKHEQSHTIHFYQDFFCAYFGRFFHHKNSRKILLLHSGNDPLNQMFTHFHSMRGTKHESRIRKIFSETLQSQDALVTLNMGYAEVLRAELPNKDIRCIYNTSPFPESDIPGRAISNIAERPIEIVAIGSLQYIKGFDLLVNAICNLNDSIRKRLHITIVGGGSEHASLQNSIDLNNLNGNITLQGQCANVAPFLMQADAFILTSRDEGFPIALIEACSFRLPIIATRVGSIPEVFDQSACLFIEKSAESIAATLTAIGAGNVDLAALSKKSQEIFETKLSQASFLNAYCDLFNKIGVPNAN